MYSCPIGALQVTIAGAGGIDLTATQTLWARLSAISTSLPMLVIGFLAIVGATVGRAPCGWLCPFGWLQDLLNKIPTPKFKGPDFLRYLKYVILVVFVFVLPAFWLDGLGFGEPSFCKFICPAGTLEGGLPFLVLSPGLKSQLGWLFTWKAFVLAVLLVAMVFFKRPFCRWVCPLGAFYGPFNKISIYKLEIDHKECIRCGLCSKACPVDLNVPEEIHSAECLHCLDCVKVCPTKCLKFQTSFKNNKKSEADEPGAEQIPDFGKS
jgi:polyferredoxin